MGSSVELTLSSDLFPESLDVTAHVAWVSDQRVGVSFDADCTRARALSPAEWVEQVVAHGRVFGPEPVGASGPRLVPAVRRPASASRGGVRVSQASRDGSDGDDALVLPFPRG